MLAQSRNNMPEAKLLVLLQFIFLLISPGQGDEWRPIKRKPTNEYVPPAMERVHYWHERPPTMDHYEVSSLRPYKPPVPPFMLLPPSLKNSPYLNLWTTKDDPSINNVDDSPWKWKDSSESIGTITFPLLQSTESSIPVREHDTNVNPMTLKIPQVTSQMSISEQTTISPYLVPIQKPTINSPVAPLNVREQSILNPMTSAMPSTGTAYKQMMGSHPSSPYMVPSPNSGHEQMVHIPIMTPMPVPSEFMAPPLPPPSPQTTTTTSTTTERATTQRTTTTTVENNMIDLVQPLQLIIEGHSKVRKYGVTYLPFELAKAPVFKKEEKEELN